MSAEWRKFNLGDLTDWSSGGTPSKKNTEFWIGTIPWISASSMRSTRYSESELKITPEGLKSGSRLAPMGSILLLVRGSILHQKIPVGITTRDVAFNQDVKAIQIKRHLVDSEVIDNWYLFYWFKANEKLLLSIVESTGIGAGKLDTKQLQGLEVDVPSWGEQQQIVACCKAIEEKEIINAQINQTLEQIAQAIFKSWFVDFEPVKAKIAALEASGSQDDALLAAMQVISGKDPQQLTQLQTDNPEHYTTLRATAELFPAGMQESELGEIPEGWGTGSFKDLCLTVESGGTPKRNTPEYWGGEIKWLASGEVRDVVVLDTKEKITESGLKNSSAKLWPMYTTVVAMYGATAGQVCLIADQMTSNQACCGLIPKKNYRAFTFFSAKRSIQSLSEKASGSAQQNLNKGLVEGHPAILPSEAILVVYEDIAFPLMLKWIENMRESIMLAELRYTLLPKLLSGELSVSDLQTTNTEAAADV